MRKNLFINYLSIAVLAMTCVCCGSGKSLVHNESIQDIAVAKLGESVVVELNDLKSLALCYVIDKPSMEMPGNNLRFSVYDVLERKWLYSEQKYNATVEWQSSTILVIHSKPGMISNDPNTNEKMIDYKVDIQDYKK
ncbi:hypothetical protein KDU71_16635 [Carboxylicivirga sediminis]|uniref:Uncharacterized protein n=1 Tax=Carboxylicivirga sediminis TaxID=2006564 RepID=A0A941F7S9_9BACT|nr:hypothetical protein [Carboxylicivirga sediminis]MBR8537199.1 hypothetical protein [Carboxylicivirga sediminis]